MDEAEAPVEGVAPAGPDGGDGPAAFGARLRRHRLAAGLTQEALAERAGLSARGLQELERGARRPLPDTVGRLAGALALPPEAHAAFAAAAPPATRRPRGAPGRVPAHGPSALPVPLTRLVGREQELAEVGRLLGQTRLLTLTGPGGIGKTRLALAVARDVAGADGANERTMPAGEAVFADLAPLADPELVPAAVAAALRVPEQPGRPLLGALVAAVGSRGVLLVLDNCEHLLDACATLAAGLLGACPVLRVLATSREPLAVAGEAVWPVPPLALPPAARPAGSSPPSPPPAQRAGVTPPSPPPAQEGAGGLAGSGAVRLFVDRAAAAAPGFALTAGNAGAVAEVCRRLDGLPLALELAAPRVRGLGVVALAARLGAHFDRLDLLAGGRGPGPPRQRTLRATLDWSYDLLSPAEQALFARLAVFAGGFDLAAAEAVGRGAEPAAEGDAGPADLLARLVDRSLVATESPAPPAPPAPPGSAADGGPAGVRYRLLETVREYAAERLADEGHAAAAAVRRRHAEHYAALAERAEPALRWSGQASWVARLEREHDNARAALGWALDAATADTQVPRTARDAAALALRLAVAYGAFWQLRGYLAEGRRWLEAALAADLAAGAGGAAPPGLALRAHATFWLGLLSWLGGDLPAGRARLEESVARLRAQNAPVGLGLALSHLGQLALAQGDAAGARRLTEEAVALLRRRGDAWELGVALTHLGDVADEQGDAAGARRLYDESAALLRRAGDATMLALPLAWSARLAAAAGDSAGARDRYEEALAAARAAGHPGFAGIALQGLGDLALQEGDAEQAAARFAEGLALQQRMGRAQGAAQGLAGLAAVALVRGDPARAARLLGAAVGLRAGAGAAPDAAERAAHDQAAAAARAALGDAATAAASAVGEAMTLEQAVAYALEN